MDEQAPLTVREVAERLRVKEGTVRRWLHSGKLRGTFLGGQTGYRIPPTEVQRFEREGPADGKR